MSSLGGGLGLTGRSSRAPEVTTPAGLNTSNAESLEDVLEQVRLLIYWQGKSVTDPNH